MKYTEIAGRKVSAMSLGTAQLGVDYGIANTEGKPSREQSSVILQTALDNGVTALDTARSYGDAEDVLGAFFAANPETVEKVFITTKVQSGLPAGTQSSDVEKALYQSTEASLSHLGLKKVNCLMLHNASDLTIHGRTIRDTMERMIKQGYADIAGVSVYHPAEAETILEDRLWEAIQIPMSLFDQRFIIQGTIEKLESHGIHVFVRSVFLQGIVFLDPDEITEPDLERLAVPHIRTLRKISERAGISPGQFAIAFLRDLPGITSLVLGAENPKQVIENAALFETRTLDSAIRLEVETAFSGFDYSGVMAILARTYGRSGQYKK